MPPPQEPPRSPLTRAGRVLAGSLLLAFGAGLLAYLLWIHDALSPGRYPLLLFAVPVGLGCFLLFFGCAWILERRGIAVWRKPGDRA
jgi:hypothetical protein